MHTTEKANSVNVETLVDALSGNFRPILTEFVRQILENDPLPSQKKAPKEDEQTPDLSPTTTTDFPEIKEMAEMAGGVKQMLEKIDILIDDEAKFNKMHDELDEHRKGLYRKLLSPLLKNIVAQYSKISDLYAFYYEKQKQDSADKTALFDNLLKEYQNLRLSLSDLLYDYDIEVVEAQAGEAFNPKKQKAVKTTPTDCPELDRTIAACITLGFKDMTGNEQMIKYPEVEIYKLNQENGQ